MYGSPAQIVASSPERFSTLADPLSLCCDCHQTRGSRLTSGHYCSARQNRGPISDPKPARDRAGWRGTALALEWSHPPALAREPLPRSARALVPPQDSQWGFECGPWGEQRPVAPKHY